MHSSTSAHLVAQSHGGHTREALGSRRRRQPAAQACGDGFCARVEEAWHGRGGSGVARFVASTTMAAHARAGGEGESERGAVVDLITKAS